MTTPMEPGTDSQLEGTAIADEVVSVIPYPYITSKHTAC